MVSVPTRLQPMPDVLCDGHHTGQRLPASLPGGVAGGIRWPRSMLSLGLEGDQNVQQ